MGGWTDNRKNGRAARQTKRQARAVSERKKMEFGRSSKGQDPKTGLQYVQEGKF